MTVRSRAAVVALLAVVGMVAVAPGAVAHTELRASTPAPDAIVESLDTVRLDFTSDILDIGSELALVDAGGDVHELVAEYPEPSALAATVDVELPAGDTVLQWRIVAEDGHPIEGTIAFTYAPAVAASVTPSATASATPRASTDAPTPAVEPSAIRASLEATPQPSSTPAAPAGETGAASRVWIWFVVAGAVIATATAAMIAQSRRRQDDPADLPTDSPSHPTE